jgi:hypothetical protein
VWGESSKLIWHLQFLNFYTDNSKKTMGGEWVEDG